MKKRIKNTIKAILIFIDYTIQFIIFLFKFLQQNSYRNHLRKENSGTVAVLANGPSLKEEIPRLSIDAEFKNVDFIVLNFFAFEESFFQIKPKHYCLADHMFFQDTHRKENVRKLYDILEKQVSWDLNLYIPTARYRDFLLYSGLTNRNLKIIKMNIIDYTGGAILRHYLYRKGLSMPPLQTVANLAIYVALNCGYSEVRLYGVDHTFFDSLCINEQNQLCNREMHFYDNSLPSLKPIIRNDNDQQWKISDYTMSISSMFKSHDLLSAYAQYMNVNIVNYTKCSLIDSYKRVQ